VKISRFDINVSNYTTFGHDVDDKIAEVIAGDAAWLTAGGEIVAALVPPEVLRFYAQFHELVPDHPQHATDGPAECIRCQILRDNADWIFQATPEVSDADLSRAVSQAFNETCGSGES
jgi:hypothetical protein